MLEKIYLLKVYYQDSSEDVLGVIDSHRKIVRLIEIDEKFEKGFREKGFINFNFIKKLEIIETAGCIGEGDDKERCFIES